MAANDEVALGPMRRVSSESSRLYAPVLAVGLLVQVVGLMIFSPTFAVVGLVLGSLAELATADEKNEFRGRLRRAGLGLLQRVTLRAVLVVATLAVHDVPGIAIVGYVGGVFVLAVAVRWMTFRLGRIVRRTPATAVRNFGEDLLLHGFFDRLRTRRTLGYSFMCGAELPLGLGLAAAGFVSTPVGVAVLTVTVLALVAAAAWVTVWARRFDRSGAVEAHVEQLEDAIVAFGPTVVVYFSAGGGGVYQLNQWLPVLNRLELPMLIMLREARHLEDMADTHWPVIVCPSHRDVEVVLPADPKVALYVGTAGRNIHFLRYARPKHVFLNHGDSDKVSSANPVVKVYDQLFVAGQIAIDRYRDAGVDLGDERFTIVGRPQLDGVLDERRRIGDGPPTLLYAPTWEGFFEAADYSSLERSGVALVSHILERHPDVRIVFKPHPASGSVRPSAGTAKRRVEALLREAGSPHILANDQPGLDLLDWFDRSDVLLSDISAVVTDFLYTDKPYLVTNPRGLSIEEFRASFPSHLAAYVVDADLGNLDDQLRNALGPDTLASDRAAMKAAVLGDHPEGPFVAFTQALDDMVAQAQRDASRIRNTFAYERS